MASGVDVRMNYAQMNEMAATYRTAAETLGEVSGEMEKIGNLLEGDGLVGDAGALFVEVVRGALMAAIATIQEKMTELSDDIQNASDEMETGVSTAKSRFS